MAPTTQPPTFVEGHAADSPHLPTFYVKATALSEREFHQLVARELVRLSREHKANDEHFEAQQCLELGRLHMEHVQACWRCDLDNTAMDGTFR